MTVLFTGKAIAVRTSRGRDGKTKYVLYRPPDTAAVLLALTDQDEAMRRARSIDSHGGDFVAARKSKWAIKDGASSPTRNNAKRAHSIKHLDWFGLYKASWKNEITPTAFVHPAKFSRALIRHIYEYLIAQDLIHPGETVLDPFGGVALGAVDAMWLGLNWVGVELEDRFCELGGETYVCTGFDADFWRRYHKRPEYVAGLREIRALCPECESALKPQTKHDRQGHVVKRQIPHRPEHIYRGNIPLWQHRYGARQHLGQARLIQGDSRHLREVITVANSRVSSPPYAKSQTGVVGIYDKLEIQNGRRYNVRRNGYLANLQGCAPGQLSAMPEGDYRASISSPPYADGCAHTGGDDPHPERASGGLKDGHYHGVGLHGSISSPPYSDGGASEITGVDDTPARRQSTRKSRPKHERGYSAVVASPPYSETRIGQESGQEQCGRGDQYGATEGQLGAMKAESPKAVISSPPWGDGAEGGVRSSRFKDPVAFARGMSARDGHKPNRHAASEQARIDQVMREQDRVYGTSDGQLGVMRNDFWIAARQVLEETYQVLQPGAVAVWVCKRYVRDHKIIEFSKQWTDLCKAVGFQQTHWVRAWLTEDKGTQLAFDGQHRHHVTKRMSFFRRLHAQKYPHLEILWEDVLIFRKPKEEQL